MHFVVSHCLKFGIDTDLYSASLQNEQDTTEISIKIKYSSGKELTFDSFAQKSFQMGHTETKCIESSQSYGNVSKVFLKHNLGFSSDWQHATYTTFKLKMAFIKVQDFPGSREYTDWVLGKNLNSFWISNETCPKDEWCKMSIKSKLS